VLSPASFQSYAGFKDGLSGDVLFDHPTSIIVAGDGHLYVADTGNAAIRRVDRGDNAATLPIMAIAGAGTPPPDGGQSGSGDGGSGGGGAPAWCYLAALAALLSSRFLSRKQ
jgi:hypothetical protein